jgi:hypothetical protein
MSVLVLDRKGRPLMPLFAEAGETAARTRPRTRASRRAVPRRQTRLAAKAVCC